MQLKIKQGTPKWHEWRNKGIGGSDAAAVLKESPYHTPYSLYREKKGLPLHNDNEDKEFIFSMGHKYEAKMRQEFSNLVGVEMNPVCFESDARPFMKASLDGFDPMVGVLEAKLTSTQVLNGAKNLREIPRHHFIQMQHQMIVAGCDIGTWFGMDMKGNATIVPNIKLDKKFMKTLILEEEFFWNRILEDREPKITENDYLVITDQEQIKIYNKLVDFKKAKDDADEQYKDYLDLLTKLAEHNRVSCGKVKLAKVKRQGSIDYKKIPHVNRMRPETLNKYRKPDSLYWKSVIAKEKK